MAALNVLRMLTGANPVIVMLVLVLSLCIWYLGPMLRVAGFDPFATQMGRLIAIAVIVVLALLVMGIIWWRKRRRERRMADEMVEDAEGDASDSLVRAEVDELRTKLRKALGTLRKSSLGRRHLYELPWYVMIGPPGAGKTTAIVNSGLSFPLADELGKTALGGVGGTRNCDWWFTNDAVLIDTAGRYTTQESDAEVDNAAWLGFLSLLKRYRKRQPINGAIVAISLSDLSLQDEITRKSHAQAIRRRLNELRTTLGVRFPVYVLVTKADLIAGFSEFFDGLGKEAREQVWGFTLPLKKRTKPDDSPVAGFDAQFQSLLDRLNAQLIERMQIETESERRSLIAGFPAQVASIQPVAREFLDELFLESRFEERPMLRGVYFTSGTQEGTPIDRLMMGMARTFGIGRQAIGSGSGTGRSYFLTRLFQGVIFPEAGLVSADDRVERRYRWTRAAAIAAVLLVSVGMTTLWTRSYLGNRVLVADAAEQVDSYRAAAAQIPASPISDTDLPAVVPALNILRDMHGNPASGPHPVPGSLTWGLYQGGAIGNEAALAYRAALNQHLLPRLLLRLEEVMQNNLNEQDLLYDALKIYLVLGGRGPMNIAMVREWMQEDWQLAYPGVQREGLREDLDGHLTALLSQPMMRIPLNGPLVEQVQQILREMPMAQRVYSGILSSQRVSDLPTWRISEVAGPAVSRVFTRSSGRSLAEGIEGVYTRRGFNEVFLREAVSVAQRIQRESYVLGDEAESEPSETAMIDLSRDVLNLYYNDFVERYESVLADIDILPLESLSHAVEVTNVLVGPASPVVNLLQAVASETELTRQEEESLVGALTSGLGVQERIVLEALERRDGPPGQYIEQRFDWLHELVTAPDGLPSPLDELMQMLEEVSRELSRLSFSRDEGFVGLPEDNPLSRFQRATARLEGPMQRWATQIATGSSGITADGTRAQINARWRSQVLPFCEQALSDRYPFNRRAGADVAMADFSRLFAPGGLIETFFNENLRRFVDTQARPMTWRPVNDADLGISDSVLAQFQHAFDIRDAFFSQGSTPQVTFQITPFALDPQAQTVTLEIDGQRTTFGHRDGGAPPLAVSWPGEVGLAGVRFDPQASGVQNMLARDGPWAWFRLLDSAEIRRTSVADRSRVIFNVGGRFALYDLQAGSVLNPFNLPALRNFSCPQSF
ncbi:type VI secretion system membrane subunit TssM [Rhodobacteraceae bacterium 2376]|uniref:Type VI secretion system membrane subunit TssM n=1 Tax=Rhabdonatronobacter sediminivivens TaxID=2743469 RepID=A0A7Z0I0F3_9RHOB|nr:type VI secretion system membrane subunit TssM [Rhabdonatronobacter sediminivivens]NYS25644.1 type VI secretion system membrane subunit TssM [Rhabdonatronobacter sediminivivens]